MRIKLKPYAKPIKHRLYCLNPQFKEKVEKEIDQMLLVGLVFLVDEATWIIPIAIHRKKDIDDIRVYVD